MENFQTYNKAYKSSNENCEYKNLGGDRIHMPSGDSICCKSISNVRETIKKYEPNRQFQSNISHVQNDAQNTVDSARSIKSLKCSMSTPSQTNHSREKISNHIVYEDQQTVIVHKEPVQQYSPKKTLARISDVSEQLTPTKCQNSSILKSKNENASVKNPEKKCSCNIFSNLSCSASGSIITDSKQILTDVSYKSKTTIAKTSNGVRIITDIYFDTATDFNWKASRIETDIPQSKILREFEELNKYCGSSPT